jgi:hypothetical protein
MNIGWSSLTFTPDSDAVQELRRAWAWLIGDSFVPLLFSVLGDVFYTPESGGVYWLNTGTAETSRVAESPDAFQALLESESANEWFMPHLIEQLHEAGKIPGPGCCYTYVTLPIFAEGKYEVANFNVVPAREHFGLTAHIHREIQSLPDGSNVRIVVGP